MDTNLSINIAKCDVYCFVLLCIAIRLVATNISACGASERKALESNKSVLNCQYQHMHNFNVTG